MTTDLATIQPTTIAELKDLASNFAASGLFGNLSPQQALVISLAGRDLGFSYTQALRAFSIIKGKPTLTADGMVAAVLARGVCEYFRPVEVSEQSATWETRRVGSEPVRYTFSMADAERAGLINDMYRRHPRRMLSARCKAYLARDVYPEVLLGLVTEDEAEEISRGQRAAPVVQAQPTARTAPAPVVVEAQVVATPAAQVVATPAAQATEAPTLDPDASVAITRAALECESVEQLSTLWRDTAQQRQAMTRHDQDAVKEVFGARKRELGGAQ